MFQGACSSMKACCSKCLVALCSDSFFFVFCGGGVGGADLLQTAMSQTVNLEAHTAYSQMPAL